MRNSGFTLVELLLVVAILGVVSAMTIPHFGQAYARVRLNTLTNDLVAVMYYAKNRAILDHQGYRLVFAEDFGQYWIERHEREDGQSEKPDKGQRIPGRWGRKFNVPSGLTLASKAHEIKFFPDGRMDKVLLEICEKKDCRILSTMWQRGRVEVLKSTDDVEAARKLGK